MSVMFVALPVALLLGGAAAWACVRCIRGGQFDDLDSRRCEFCWMTNLNQLIRDDNADCIAHEC